MPAHLPAPSLLCEGYEELYDELSGLFAPYLPADVRAYGEQRAKGFLTALADYAEIDAIFRGFRENGLPASFDDRTYRRLYERIKRHELR